MKQQTTCFPRGLAGFLAGMLMLCTVNGLLAQDAKWTFMVYLDGDNNLEVNAIDDFNEMEAIGSSDSVNIIVQMDRIEGYDDSNGNWANTRRYRVVKDSDPVQITSPVVQDMPEQNMGDPDVLEDFIEWSVTNYPADNYALILWNHGGGWRKGVQEKIKSITEKKSKSKSNKPADKYTVKEVCYDETEDDVLMNNEVNLALDSSDVHFSIIGYDACIMGLIETAYEIKDFADIMVASAEFVPEDGFNYSAILNDLTDRPDMPADSLAMHMINCYANQYDDPLQAFAAYWLHEIPVVKAKLDTVISGLLTSSPDIWTDVSLAYDNTDFYDIDMKDIYSFFHYLASSVNDTVVTKDIDTLLTALDSAVIDYYVTGNHSGSMGLSIYFPDPYYYSSGYFDDEYEIDFPNESLWPDFLEIFFIFYFTDNYEPNNYFGDASYLDEGPTTVVGAHLPDSADRDIYYFITDGTSPTEFDFSTDDLTVDFSAKLYTVIDTVITLIREDNINLDTLSLSYEGLEEGVYYLELTSRNPGFDAYDFLTSGTEYPDSFEITKAYDDGTPDYIMNSDTADNKGIVLMYPHYDFWRTTFLKGIWYYVSAIDLVPGNGDNGTFKLVTSQMDIDSFINITPEKVGWNYIDLDSIYTDPIFGGLSIGFVWDGYNTPGIGYDIGSMEFPSAEITNIEEDGEMDIMPYHKDSSRLFFIRPVLKSYSEYESCSCEELTVMTDESGSFSDGSDTLNYESGCECSWLIQPTSGNLIELTLSNFNTELYCDEVIVYDGDDKSADVLGIFSGNYDDDTTVISTGGSLLVEFITDGSITDAGWDASYVTLGDCQCTGLSTFTDASGTFSDGSGTENYGTNCSCMWLINPGSPFSLTFLDFNTEEGNDVVNVYNGMSTTDSILASLSGLITEQTVYSTGNPLLVEFVSNESRNYSGWSASYQIETGIDEQVYSGLFDIIPNPNDGQFRISIPGFVNPEIEVNIYDMVGNLMYKTTSAINIPIDVHQLAEGMYMVKIVNDNKEMMIKMVIVK